MSPHNTGKLTLLFVLIAGLQACSPSGEESGEDSAAPPVSDQTYAITVSGSVGDGPVASAMLTVLSSSGETLGNMVGNSDAGYTLDLHTQGKHYPLVIEARGGLDLVTGRPLDFTLRSLVPSPRSNVTANINPFTTLTYATARRMSGGLTQRNIADALAAVVSQFNLGMTSAVSRDPLGTRIDDSNLAEIMRASEGLAEIFRRVAVAVTGGGFPASTQTVIDSIAADLTDGTLDGRGAGGANRRVAATTTAVAAQVALETMRNELRVNGQIATSTLDNVVLRLASGASPDLTATLPVTSSLIELARAGVEAAIAMGSPGNFQSLSGDLAALRSGQTSASARQTLSSDSSSLMLASITDVAGGTAADFNLVLDGSSAPSVNTPPIITGTPATSVGVGVSYQFTPSASDADGDLLIFSIVNLPSWASFSATTGALTGMPSASDIGTFSGIAVRVSDAQETVELPTFAITVTAAAPPPPPPPPPNTPPTIAGNPPGAVAAGSPYSFVPTASDANGDSLTFSIANRPSWATFNGSTGRLSGTPSTSNVGSYSNIQISVSDGRASSTLPAFSISVTGPSNTPPTIGGNPPSSVVTDTPYTFTPTANDSDGDDLTFSIQNRPSWANFNASNGRLSGTPGPGDVGSYTNIRISVSDGTATASLPAFSVSVQAIALGSATLSWDAPTNNEDGSPLTDLSGYRVRWGQVSGTYTNTQTIMNPGLTTYVVENLSSGTHYFVVTAINSAGMESTYSNEGSKTIP